MDQDAYDQPVNGNDGDYDSDPNLNNRRRYKAYKNLASSRDEKSVIIRFIDRSLGDCTNSISTCTSRPFDAKAGEEQLWAVDLSNFDGTQSMWDYIQNSANRTQVFMVNPNTFGGVYLTELEAYYTDFNWNTAPQDGSGTPLYNTNNLVDRGLFTDADGNIYEAGTDSAKDLESVGAKVEAMEVEDLKDKLINYGLSEERTDKLSKLMVSYKKIQNKRGLTGREKDVFTKELTGMTFEKASSVLVEEGYDALVEKASDANGLDPEAIKELLNEVM